MLLYVLGSNNKAVLLQVLTRTLRTHLKAPSWTLVTWPWRSIQHCIPIRDGTHSTSSQRRLKTQKGTKSVLFFSQVLYSWQNSIIPNDIYSY